MTPPDAPGTPSRDILEVWQGFLESRPRTSGAMPTSFPPEAPREAPKLADLPVTRIADKMRGAGVNIERGAGWGDVDWGALLDAGVSWVRLFYPWRPDFEMNGPGSAAPPSDGQLHQLVQGGERAIQAGIKVVLIDCTDVLDVDPAYQHADTIEDVVRRLARLVKASSVLSIENCVYGPVNEFAGGSSDDDWKGFRDRMNAACREELPDHALASGIWYWKYLGYMPESRDPCPAGDPNWLVDCHTYEQFDWTWMADQLAAWMHANQRLIVVGEIGPYNPNWQWLDLDEWEAAYRAQAPLWPVVPVAPWAITYGSALRLNYWENLQLDDMHTGWMRDMAAAEATRPPLADGGGEPPDQTFSATLVSRTDFVLTVDLKVPTTAKWVEVQNSPPWTWIGEPQQASTGTVAVTLSDYNNFVKFVYGSTGIDVPTPEEAANYEPGNGGNGGNGGGYTEDDLQAAHVAGWNGGWDAALHATEQAMNELPVAVPPDYKP